MCAKPYVSTVLINNTMYTYTSSTCIYHTMMYTHFTPLIKISYI